MALLCGRGVRTCVPSLKFVGLFHSEDMTADALPVSALVDLMTLTFDLETGAHYIQWDGQPSYFDVFVMFISRLIGQHLSDKSRDLATLTFDLVGHGACR